MMTLHPTFESLSPSSSLHWWETKPLPVPFFAGQLLSFLFEVDPESAGWEAAQAAALTFLNLDVRARDKATPPMLADLRSMLELTSIGEGEEGQVLASIQTPEELWAQVQPETISVVYDDVQPGVPFVLIETTPAWQEEHGLQLTLRRGHELVAVTPCDFSVPDLTDADDGVVLPPLDLQTP